MDRDIIQEFHPVFHPRSIAVVGASKDETKFGHRYASGLWTAGFKGQLYAVNARGEDAVPGVKGYRSLRDIPGPVDYVIVAIPNRFVLDLMDDCAAKGVKVVQFFTAGFSETGEEEGRKLEQALVEKARAGGFRIIGPNCVGVYCPESRMSYGGSPLMGDAGSVAVISQSGGHAGRIIDCGLERGLKFSKVISFGNGSDLDSVDYLEYLAVDPGTKVIGAYLEGMRQGSRFFRLIREIGMTKPVVIWKGGRTEVGAAAAFSHTGSLAGSDAVWKGITRQAGATKVNSVEELVDTLIGFQDLSPFDGSRIAVVTGLGGGGGGVSVASGDAITGHGLEMRPFTPDTRARLKAFLPEAGAILRNPLDIGSSGGNRETLRKSLELAIGDPEVDLLLVNIPLGAVLGRPSLRFARMVCEEVVALRSRQPKPIAVYSPPTLSSDSQYQSVKFLSAARIPVFDSLDAAARAIAHVRHHWGRRRERETAAA